MKTKTNSLAPEELADKWIKQLRKAGYSYDEMITIFRLAKKKYQEIIKA